MLAAPGRSELVDSKFQVALEVQILAMEMGDKNVI